MDEFEDADEGAHEEDGNIVSPLYGAKPSSPFITGLADALPDPPDDVSDVHDDEENDAELPKTTSEASASSPKNRSSSEGIGKTVTNTTRTADTSAQIDGDEHAALINNFMVVNNEPKTLPSTANGIPANLKQRNTSRLKRLSRKGEHLYRGIAPSSGVQRRLVSNPKDVFEVDVSPEHFIAPKRPERAISVDPSSMTWQVRDTTHNAATRKRNLSPQIETELSSATNTTALRSKMVQDRDVDSGRAHSSPVFPDSVQQRALGSGRKRGRPRIIRPADPDGLVPTPSENLPGATKRGRPPKVRPSEAGNPEAVPAQIISTGKKRGRPSKAGPEAAGNPETRPQKALKMTATQNGPTSDSAEKAPMALETTSANEPSSRSAKAPDTSRTIRDNPVDPVQNVGEPQSPLFEDRSIPSREPPREIPRNEVRPEPNESPREPTSDTGVSRSSVTHEATPGDRALDGSARETDARESQTGDSQAGNRPRSVAQSAHSPSESNDDEHNDVEIIVSESKGLQAAFRLAKQMGSKREGKHYIEHELPAVKSAAVQDLLQVHEQAYHFISKLVAAEEAVTSERNLELRALIKSVSKKACDIIRDPKWDNKRTVRDLYVHVLPKLTMLLQELLEFCGAELTFEQLKVSQILMRAIVNLGLKVKEAKSKFTSPFPVKAIRNGILRNMRQALEESQDRTAEIESRRKAQVRNAKHEEYLRHMEEKEMQSQFREKEVQAWKARWNSLHCDRLIAELQKTRLLPAATLRHLGTPPLKLFGASDPELDGNGEPMERVEVFGRRQTLPPGHSGTRNVIKWTQDESYALVKGLREFSGPRVYHKIFSQYCQAGQLLNKYNVSEIVDRAMWLREQMIKTQRETQQEPWAWLLAISDPRAPPVFDG